MRISPEQLYRLARQRLRNENAGANCIVDVVVDVGDDVGHAGDLPLQRCGPPRGVHAHRRTALAL